ncbi:MAG: aminoglycoside phosphotransferase family protein [Acidimicrobiales bacterium]
MTVEAALAALRDERQIQLTLEGRCPGGEVGAYFVCTSDGVPYVMKWSKEPSDLEAYERLVPVLRALRSDGYPLPEHLQPIRVDGGAVLLQERVDGSWSDTVDDALVTAVLSLNELQKLRGDDAGTWTQFIQTTLLQGADGYCIHETLRLHDKRSRRVLGWVLEVGRSLPQLPGTDIVHFDFHHRNMLRQGEHLSAVVDWGGARFGDRAFDLVTFCLGFTHAVSEPGREEAVWRRATSLTRPDALRAYVAHVALRRLDWTIRHHPDEIDRVAEMVDRYVAKCA